MQRTINELQEKVAQQTRTGPVQRIGNDIGRNFDQALHLEDNTNAVVGCPTQ